jgi:CSLREA domain-containing protein
MPGRLSSMVLVALIAAAVCALCATCAGAATVTKTTDSKDGACDADCSLREAIAAADPGETIVVPASPTPYEVIDGFPDFGSLVIEKDLTIVGAGARQTAVTAPGSEARPFTVKSAGAISPVVTIRDLTISGGNGGSGGFAAQGGGIMVGKAPAATGAPTLTLERVRVTGNKASSNAGQAVGGGITADGSGTKLIVRDSLVDANEAIGAGKGQATGGGIATFASATATIENTTVVGNLAKADDDGLISARAGGIFLVKASSIVNATIYGNKTERTDPGATLSTAGNLIGTEATVTVANTIVGGGKADDSASADCSAGFKSLGGNVLPPTCGPTSADRLANDPLLGPLAANGGTTDTMALLSGSPAIDAGVGCPLSTDQRAFPRPSGAGCDAGAYELQVPGSTVVVQLIEKKQQKRKKKKKQGKKNTAAVTCQGKKATIVGNARKNTLRGTKKADVIVALAGNDTIRGRGGNDLICAGKGSDKLIGGPGKDRLLGQKGADRLFGGPGLDKLLGGQGKDLQLQ